MRAEIPESFGQKPDNPNAVGWYEERYRRLGHLAAAQEASMLLEKNIAKLRETMLPKIPDQIDQARQVLNAGIEDDKKNGWDIFIAPRGYTHRVITPGGRHFIRNWFDVLSPAETSVYDSPFAARTERVEVADGDQDQFFARELRVYGDGEIYVVDLARSVAQSLEPHNLVAMVKRLEGDDRPAGSEAPVLVDGSSMLAARYPHA